ncbi:MAG: ribosomal RNA small subunit methyltransferase H [Candidatus Babeliales bacterium]
MQDKKFKPGHKPVLMNEVLEYLDIKPKGTYLDVTFGAGGHTRAILEQNKTCRVIAMDWDATALETFGQPLKEEFGDRIELIWGNFSLLYKLLKKYDINQLDGILADFGTSQVQIAGTPGLSVFRDTPLDMRLSPAHQQVTAADILNKANEQKLEQIFFQLGEESKGRQIARAIVRARSSIRFVTTGQLVDVIETVIPNKGKRSIHPATKVFQALRIYVNHELDNIQAFLPAALKALAPEGRLLCISFHSLEDRLVKQYFQEQERLGIIEIVTKRAITACDEELAQNPSARSAKLRVAQKI